MRKSLAEYLLKEMAVNKDIFFVTGDLGYKLWDTIRDTFPDRFYNVGASEMAGVLICVGLALEGKIPIFYSISSFAVYRPFEVIHTYLHHEQIPVKIIGSGRDFDYKIDGFSHHSPGMKKILGTMPNIKQYWPNKVDNLPNMFEDFIYNKRPSFISLRK